MAKSLNKQQLVNVMVTLMTVEFANRGVEVEKEDLQEWLEEATVEELVEATQHVGEACDSFLEDPEPEVEEEMEDEEPAAEASLQDILDNLHVGINVVPGLGVGYAGSEEDLSKMKAFLVGAWVTKKMFTGGFAQD